jgi:hypothetical protein
MRVFSGRYPTRTNIVRDLHPAVDAKEIAEQMRICGDGEIGDDQNSDGENREPVRNAT